MTVSSWTARAVNSALPPAPLMPAATPLGHGLARRIKRQFREADLAATVDESTELDRLHRAMEAGLIAMPEVSAALTALLRSQNQRAAARAA